MLLTPSSYPSGLQSVNGPMFSAWLYARLSQDPGPNAD